MSTMSADGFTSYISGGKVSANQGPVPIMSADSCTN